MEKLRQELHAPLGRLTMAFSALEHSLSWLIGELLGGDYIVRDLLTSQLSFQRLLNVADGTYRHKVTDAALIGHWNSLQGTIAACEERRNAVTHSSWGIWWEDQTNIYVSQEKTRIKRGKGLLRSKILASAAEISQIAVHIEETNLELIDLLIETNKKGFIHIFDEHLKVIETEKSCPNTALDPHKQLDMLA